MAKIKSVMGRQIWEYFEIFVFKKLIFFITYFLDKTVL